MNFPIIYKKVRRFNKISHYFIVLIMSLSLSLNIPGLTEPKSCQFEEKTGTIRRICLQRLNIKRIIAVCALKEAFTWLIIVLLAPAIFGQWGFPISLIALIKVIPKSRFGLSLMCDKEVFCEVFLSMVQKASMIVMLALIASFVFITVPLDASLLTILPDPVTPTMDTHLVRFATVSSVALKPTTAPNEKSKEEKLDANYRHFRKRYKLSFENQILLYRKLCENPEITSRDLLSQFPQIQITIDQLNRIRKEWGLSAKRGRPKVKNAESIPKEKTQPVFAHRPKVGLSLFDMWLDETNRYEEVLETIYELIEAYKQEHPQENFRLLKSSKVVIARKWKALNLLALAGIKKFSELDYQQHDLDRILVDGQNYSYHTLRQFLGELERVNAGASLKILLAKCVKGDWAYIDGHMIALWSRLKMHKGYVTMLGRIMPASKAVFTHDQLGQVIGFEFYPADTHLLHIIEEYCKEIVDLTGVTNFIIDREINSVEVAKLFDSHRWGLICLLDANQYSGLESFSKKFSKQLPDGSVLYKATWDYWRDDPRYFVVVEQPDRTLVYWYTKSVARQRLTAQQIVTLYRNRGGIQENGFKQMIKHGALNTNFGNKKVWGPDRTHQRKIDRLDKKIAKLVSKERKIQQLICIQEDKIRQSRQKQHPKLLVIREQKLTQLLRQQNEIQAKIDAIETQKQQIGRPCLRGDRDFRKQTIMTFRTAWTENALRDFVSLITNLMDTPVDIEIVLELFFYRSAIMVETDSRISYWMSDTNLSPRYRGVLEKVVEGFNRISLTSRGKPILVEIAN